LLPADLDRLLGTDRQLRRGQVGVRGQRLVPGSRGGPAAVGVPTAVGGRGAGSLVGGLLGGRVAAAAVGLRGAVALLGGAGAVGGRGGVRALVGGAAAPGDQGDGERPQGGRPGGAPSREDRGSHGFSTFPTESCRVGPRTPAGAGCPQARAPIAARREAENTLIPGSSAPTGRLGAGPRALPRPARRSYGGGVDPRAMPWGTRAWKSPGPLAPARRPPPPPPRAPPSSRRATRGGGARTTTPCARATAGTTRSCASRCSVSTSNRACSGTGERPRG